MALDCKRRCDDLSEQWNSHFSRSVWMRIEDGDDDDGGDKKKDFLRKKER